MAIPALRIPVDLEMGGFQRQSSGILSSTKDMLGAIQREASSTSGALSGIGGGLGAVTLGLGGAATAALGFFTALSKVSSELAGIAQTAQYLSTTTENAQVLKFAGQSGGLSGEQSVKDLENVRRLMDEALRDENSLSKLLDANGVKFKDRSGQLISINDLLAKGGTLIQNAGSYLAQVDVAKRLGLSREWVPVLLQIAQEGFGGIAEAASKAGVIIDRETIAKAQLFDDAWKSTASGLATQFKSAFVDIGSFIDDLITKLGDLLQKAADASNLGDGQSKFNAMADAAEILARQEAGVAQNLDQVGRALENAKSKASPDPEIIATLQAIYDKAKQAADEIARIGYAGFLEAGAPLPTPRPAGAGVPTNPTKRPGKDDTSGGRDRFESSADSIEKRTKALAAETATIDLGTEARNKAKIAAELEATAVQINKEAGLGENVVTDEQRKRIDALAESYGKVALAAERAHSPLATFARDSADTEKQLNQFSASSLNTVTDELANVVTHTKTVADAFKSMATSIIQDLARIAIRKAITGPIASALGGIFGFGGGGGLGSLFGGGSSPGVDPSKFASGGFVSGPGGSRSDSILSMLSNGEYVVNADAAQRYRTLLDAINNGTIPKFATGGPVSVPNVRGSSVSYGSSGPMQIVVDVRGATGNEEIQRMVQSGVRQGLTAYDKSLPDKMPALLTQAQVRAM